MMQTVIELVVLTAFGNYSAGQTIIDQQTIATILAGPNAGNVVEITSINSATGGGSSSSSSSGNLMNYLGTWMPGTAYAIGNVVYYENALYLAAASFTSGASFNSSNWTAVGLSSGSGLQPSSIPAASGALLGGSMSAGQAVEVEVGSGLTLSSGTLTLGSVALSSIAQSGASTGQVAGWTGTAWAPTSINGGGGGGGTPGGTSGELQYNSGGAFAGVTLGSGLAFASGTLSATGGGSYTLPAATTSVLGGVKSDGSTVSIAEDGTLSIVTEPVGSLTNISTLGGPIASDIVTVNRSGADYQTTIGAELTAVALPNLVSDSGGTITCNSAASGGSIVTLTGAGRTMEALSNRAGGRSGIISLLQGNANSTITTWDASWDFGSAGTPTLSTTAGKKDLLSWWDDGTTVNALFRAGF